MTPHTAKRGWWIDDDGFLRHPDNIEAFDLDDCVGLLDNITAERDALRDALQSIHDMGCDAPEEPPTKCYQFPAEVVAPENYCASCLASAALALGKDRV